MKEQDDLDDPGLSRFLKRWCGRTKRRSEGVSTTRNAQRSPAFASPRDAASLSRALDAVDAEVERRGALRTGISDAGGWLAEKAGQVADALSALPVLSGLRLAPAYAGTLRGGAATELRSGERLVLRFTLDRTAAVFVAMLEASGGFVPVSTSPKQLPPGDQELGPFRLDAHPGVETFVVLASSPPRDTEAFVRIVENAARSAAQVETRDEKLAAVLACLQGITGILAQEVTFTHLP